jgi:Zn ribbon nucleic-acid-binding protein
VFFSFLIWESPYSSAVRVYILQSQSIHPMTIHCKAFGHVSSVCRREKPRCPSCGKDHIMCLKSEENVTCCNCGGNHEATSFDCSTRVKENELPKSGLSRAFHMQLLLKSLRV